jgi:hypothetical protein
MCPVCIATATLVAVGATCTGGLGALVVKNIRIRKKRGTKS